MEQRSFGQSGRTVSALGMGAAKLGAFWQRRGIREGAAAVAAAVDGGITYFDTADCYARGLSERVLGRGLGRRRDGVTVATKVGLLKTPLAHRAARRATAGTPVAVEGGQAACFAPAYLRTATERSLRRLRSDRIDVLMLHSPPLAVIERAEFAGAVDALRAAGKISLFGISCEAPEHLDAAVAAPGVDCVQAAYNLADRRAAPGIAAAAAAGVAVVARAPFGDGSLLAPADPRRVKACLQFALAAPGVAVVLAGMSTAAHVAANTAAVGAADLAPEEMREIEERALDAP